MAKAIRNNGTLSTGDVFLCMSQEEASTLRTIFQFIGGSSDNSRRKHVDDMRKALKDIDVECDTSDIEDWTSAIIFVAKPSFNVGDVVEIVGNSRGYKAKFLQNGEVGRVVEVFETYCEVAMFKDPEQYNYHFANNDLKLLRKAKG